MRPGTNPEPTFRKPEPPKNPPLPIEDDGLSYGDVRRARAQARWIIAGRWLTIALGLVGIALLATACASQPDELAREPHPWAVCNEPENRDTWLCYAGEQRP